jgi:hypothetical protein
MIICAVSSMAAQMLDVDTTELHPDTILVHSDTFYLQDQQMVADVDLLLLNLIAQQSRKLHVDSLDSISSDDTLTLAQLLYLDSLAREMREIDSLRALNATLVEQVVEELPLIDVDKSWVKDVEEDRNDVLRAIRDMRTPWRKEATIMLQITQNYVTDNWYQGGSSSFAGLGIAKGQIGYYTDRFTWENTGEWRVGASTVSADSLHKVNTTDDMLRLYSKANLKIIPKLFASVSLEFETRFLPTYKSNSNELKSGPFSPIRYNMGLGMDYKPIKGLSISFSPLSYKMVYIMDTTRVTESEYGLSDGQSIQHNVGSSVRVEYLWKPVREVELEAKFYLYTNYHQVELDLELNCDFIINRFLSARVMLHPRYDSSVIMKDDTHAKIQFRELISEGFAHKFR